MGKVITVSGPHGTGKSTYAKAIATKLELKLVSAGQIFRNIAAEKKLSLSELSSLAATGDSLDKQIDGRVKEFAREGNVVLEGQLAAWMAGPLADVRIHLTAPDEVRIRRIAEREKMPYKTAKEETFKREQIQKDRFKRYYGIDVEDISLYDLIIDTSLHSVEGTKAIILEAIDQLVLWKK